MPERQKQTEAYIYPKEFFEKNKPNITKGLCFVIMPFQGKMNRVYDEVISKAILECGLNPIRADQIFDTRPIMISVMEKISEAEIIIADVTGRNPNVFYELGMAHIVKDRVVLLTQEIEDVPFDLRHFRFILYEDSKEGDLKLHEKIKETLSSIGAVGTTPILFTMSEEQKSESVTQVIASEITSVIINFGSSDDWTKKKGKLFAALVNFIDFENITDTSVSLTFPQGQIWYNNGVIQLTLRPGDLQLHDLLKAFRDEYHSIQYNLNTKFDLADIVKRSRHGIREIKSVFSDRITFILRINKYPWAYLDIINTDAVGSALLYTTGNRDFQSGRQVVGYGAIAKYLFTDPPGSELEQEIKSSLGINFKVS